MARQLTAAERRRLRRTLADRHPWLTASDRGPQAVDAGECTRCEVRPRLLPTCGPTAGSALCRECAVEVGVVAWCDGHRDEALAALAWAGGLPPDWATIVRVWWVATGEVRLDPALAAHPAISASIAASSP